jgi:hypothetical protein
MRNECINEAFEAKILPVIKNKIAEAGIEPARHKGGWL